jgi:hypothetical protein
MLCAIRSVESRLCRIKKGIQRMHDEPVSKTVGRKDVLCVHGLEIQPSMHTHGDMGGQVKHAHMRRIQWTDRRMLPSFEAALSAVQQAEHGGKKNYSH